MALSYGTDEWLQTYDELAKQRMAGGPPFIFGMPEWVATYEKLIQEDAPYKEAAKTWEGTVILRVLKKPEIGLDIDLYIFMDLWHGDCRYVRIVPPDVGEAGDFVIAGEYGQWKAVVKKELDVVKGMMQNKLKLKGDLPYIVRAVKAAARLTEISTMVETIFPDEAGPDVAEQVKAFVAESAPQLGL
jgi:putative sterol carrier protein